MRVLLLCFFGVCFSASVFAGDLLLYKQEKEAGFFRLYLEPTHMKMEMSEDGKVVKSSMIYSKEKQEAMMVDHGSKKFTVLDKSTIEKMANKMGAAFSQMKEAMSKMPPEMQKMMKEKMGALQGGADLPTEVKKAGSGEAVGRWKATRYEVSRGKTLIAETWTVSLKEAGVEPKNFEILKDMSAMYAGVGKELKGLIGNAGAMDMETWKKMEGFPVKTVSRAHKGDRAYVLESVEQKSFSDSEFAEPSGYKKREIGKMANM